VFRTLGRSVGEALIHAFAWGGTAICVVAIFQHSDARLAYALLSGWWAALYVGHLGRVRLAAALPAAFLYAVARGVDSLCGFQVLYHDSPSRLSPSFAAGTVLGTLVFISPIVVNAVVRTIRDSSTTPRSQ
jgi:hypothetical protein